MPLKVHVRLAANGGTLCEGNLEIPEGVDIPGLTDRVRRIVSHSGSSYIGGTGIYAEVIEVANPDPPALVSGHKRSAAGTKKDGTPRKRNTAKSPNDKRLQADPPSREDARKGGKKAGAIQKARAKAANSGQKELL